MKKCVARLILLTVFTINPANAQSTPSEPRDYRLNLPDGPAQPIPMPTETVFRWYGWQLMTVDLVSDLLMFGGRRIESGGVTVLGLTSAVFGGPALHGIHGSWRRALVSLVLRDAGFATMIGMAMRCPDGECTMYIGIPLVASQLLDAAILGWKRVPVRPLRHRTSEVSWWPALALDRDRLNLTVYGVF